VAEHEQPEQTEFDLGLSDEQKLRSELEMVRQQNAGRMQYLASLTPPMRPDPVGVLMTRLDTFLSMLDEKTRLLFELAFERNMVEALEKCLSQAAHIQLTQGVGAPPNGKMPPGGRIILPGQ
jgi:hypothetical protein